MNAQDQFWSGAQGDQYTDRNRVDWWARVPFWADVMARTFARRVFEVGCNAGWNLIAIRSLNFAQVLSGCDVNAKAVQQARAAGLNAKHCAAIDIPPAKADLVFTAGVLIHIAPENLEKVMRRIALASERHVLAIEYEHGFEQEIEYRGERQRLWRRPYGQLYEQIGLRVVDQWPAGDGFDRCTAWLLTRGAL